MHDHENLERRDGKALGLGRRQQAPRDGDSAQAGALDGKDRPGCDLASDVRKLSYLMAASGADLTVGALTVTAAQRKEMLEVLGTLITDARWMQRRFQALRNLPEET